MAHALTKFSLMSPELMATQLNAAFGSTVITKFGLLDPTLMEKQINAHVGSAVFRASGPKDRGVKDPHWSPDGLSIAMGV